MHTSIMLTGNIKRIKINVEKFDVGNMKDIRNSIEKEISRKSNNIVIDFSEVNFIDSSGLSVIIGAFKKIKGMRGKLRLCGLKSQPLQLLKVTQLHKILNVVEKCDTIKK